MPKPHALSAILLISCFSAACSYLPGRTDATQQPSLSEIHADNSGPVIPVNLDNYKVAESDEAFYNITKLVGMNTFFHFPIGKFDLDNQTVVRMNRDTYYSAAIIDASEGATITIPETNGRYLSVMVVENDHYIPQVFLEPGTHEIKTATPFAMVAMRIRSNNNDPDDAAKIEITMEAYRFNAYLRGYKGTRQWQPGDFLVHFAGVYEPGAMAELMARMEKGEVPRLPM